MPILNTILSWLMKKRYHQIELFMKYPMEVQQEWFRRLIHAGENTEFGQKYSFSNIDTLDKYREIVPVSEYEDLEPYISRVMRGEQKVLWPTDIKWFAKSSGTTSSRSKFIPVSQESLEECHFKGGKDMLSLYCMAHDETSLFDGRSMGLGGTHQVSEVNSEAFYGDLSAIIIQNLPFWAEFIRTPDISIALMSEWEAKLDKMAKASLGHNVTSVAGVPSWTLLLMRKALEISGATKIEQIWPNMEVFFHGGVSLAPYMHQFEQIMPPSMYYMETYNASEGFFGLQDRFDHDDMLLMLDYGIFYEFIPMTGPKQGQAIGLGEVEKGISYAIVISTNAGLWRYQVGDTIEFTTLFPFRIRITGRTRSFINIFGEELIVDNAERALMIACEKCHSVVEEFTVAPGPRENGNIREHEWLIEFIKEPDDVQYFIEVLDNALKACNSDYEAKRYHNLLLRKPILTILEKGTFYKWLKQKNKLGGQNKVPRLSNNRDFADELHEMISIS